MVENLSSSGMDRITGEVTALRRSIDASQAAWDAAEKDAVPEPDWWRAWHEVRWGGEAVIRAAWMLCGRPPMAAAPQIAPDPPEKGGPLVQ